VLISAVVVALQERILVLSNSTLHRHFTAIDHDEESGCGARQKVQVSVF
jgi:hypothetical protein